MTVIQLSLRLSRHRDQETSSHRREQTGTGRGLKSPSLYQMDSAGGCEETRKKKRPITSKLALLWCKDDNKEIKSHLSTALLVIIQGC